VHSNSPLGARSRWPVLLELEDILAGQNDEYTRPTLNSGDCYTLQKRLIASRNFDSFKQMMAEINKSSSKFSLSLFIQNKT
jgi:hypothetical protein